MDGVSPAPLFGNGPWGYVGFGAGEKFETQKQNKAKRETNRSGREKNQKQRKKGSGLEFDARIRISDRVDRCWPEKMAAPKTAPSSLFGISKAAMVSFNRRRGGAWQSRRGGGGGGGGGGFGAFEIAL